MAGALNAAGDAAQEGVQAYLKRGVPPPLSTRSVTERRRQGIVSRKPLIRTGQLLAGVTYVVKKRRDSEE
jgi:hypothetical protein